MDVISFILASLVKVVFLTLTEFDYLFQVWFPVSPTEGVTEDTLTLKLIYRRQSVVVGTTDGKTTRTNELTTE